MTYDEVLTHFQVKKRYQDKAQCQCPAHDDKQASLTVTKGRDSVLIHCHANCSTENVLSAAGLNSFYYPDNTDMVLVMSNDTYISCFDLTYWPQRWQE